MRKMALLCSVAGCTLTFVPAASAATVANPLCTDNTALYNPGNGQDIAEIEEKERRGENRDPLGRSDGNFGDSVATGQDTVPLELERQKSREILDELRRRAGEQQRPKEELDYIDRLLKTY